MDSSGKFKLLYIEALSTTTIWAGLVISVMGGNIDFLRGKGIPAPIPAKI